MGVFNKCSEKIAIILKEISEILGVEIVVEIEAISEGGVREIFVAITNHPIVLNAVGTAFAGLFVWYLTQDPRESKIKDLDTQIKEEQLKELRENRKIREARSIYYETTKSYSKIEKIEFSPLAEDKTPIKEKSKSVERKDFDKFIIQDELEEIKYDNSAELKIIAPVLERTDRELQWCGEYNDRRIWFLMDDKDFQNGVIERKYDLTNQHNKIDKALLEIKAKNDADGKRILNSEKYRIVKVVMLNGITVSDDKFEPKTPPKNKINSQDSEQRELFPSKT